MIFALLPISFYVTVLLVGIGIAICIQGMRQGWGLPGIVVMLTVGAWYIGDALYNDYESYFWEFGRDTLENAWWQTALFVMAFLALVKPIHDGINRSLAGRESFAIKTYERKLLHENEIQNQIDRVFGILFAAWLVLMLVALWRTNWDFFGLFTPYFSGHRAVAWERGRIGGQFDAFISLAQYLHIFLASSFGLIWVVSHRPRTRQLAGWCFLLSAPYFVLGRARNVMLAVVTPALLAWVSIRLRTTWLVRSLVILGAFMVINFWMLFVLQNRDISIVNALQMEESFEKASQGEHAGLNMFKELSYINHYIKLGTYQPNWGARYWADIVNPIPRGLWPDKPYVGLDYALVRGMGEGGFAEQMKEGVAATISTGMIGQGVVNFGTIFGPIFAALLMAIWVAMLARQDLQAEDHPSRFLLYALGIILTFNMGRDITFIVTYPFFFGYAFVYYLERKRVSKATGGRIPESRDQRSEVGGQRPEVGGRRPEVGGQRPEVGGQRSEVGGQRSAGGEMSDQRRDVGTGGTVRSMPTRTPKRIARWMPRRLRAAVVAQRAAEEGASAEPQIVGGSVLRKDGGSVGHGEKDQGTKRPKDQETVAGRKSEVGGQREQQQRPRQVGVPFQNYRRYRG